MRPWIHCLSVWLIWADWVTSWLIDWMAHQTDSIEPLIDWLIDWLTGCISLLFHEIAMCFFVFLVLSTVVNHGPKMKERHFSSQVDGGESSKRMEAAGILMTPSSTPSSSNSRRIDLYYDFNSLSCRTVEIDASPATTALQVLQVYFSDTRCGCCSNWALFEQRRSPSSPSLHRLIEDHERIADIEDAWNRQQTTDPDGGASGDHHGNRFVVKQDYCKYEVFRNPKVSGLSGWVSGLGWVGEWAGLSGWVGCWLFFSSQNNLAIKSCIQDHVSIYHTFSIEV